MLEKYLQDIGLSEKESVIYLALLAVDNSSVLDLSKKTKLNRSTTYVILESLAKKGLVSETTQGKKTHYQAESPERLETYIEQRKIILDEQAKKLKDIIPQIKSVQREGGEKPVVKYFEGREGIFALNESLYKDENEGGSNIVHIVYSKDLLDEVFPENERKKFIDTRIQKKIKSKTLYTWSKGVRQSDDTAERFKLDEVKYPISCDISVSGDRIRIGILGKSLSGIFIKSIDLANTLRSMIDALTDSMKNK